MNNKLRQDRQVYAEYRAQCERCVGRNLLAKNRIIVVTPDEDRQQRACLFGRRSLRDYQMHFTRTVAMHPKLRAIGPIDPDTCE